MNKKTKIFEQRPKPVPGFKQALCQRAVASLKSLIQQDSQGFLAPLLT